MKVKYSENFDLFWKAYPRKVAKPTAFKAWEKQAIDEDAFLTTQIVGDIEKRTRLRWWSTDQSKIPHAATWINQGRWLDEGWQDEVKTRGKETLATYTPNYHTGDDGPEMSIWALVVNRVTLNYFRHTGGLTDERLAQMLKTKNATVREMSAALDEEIAADKTKSGEMAVLLVETLLKRLDMDLDLNLSARIFVAARRK